MLLVITLPISALMIAVLRGEYGAQAQVQLAMSQDTTVDNMPQVDLLNTTWQELWDMQNPQILKELDLTKEEFVEQYNIFVKVLEQSQDNTQYNSTDLLQSRSFWGGQEVRGPFAPSDMGGINYLFNEMQAYLWLGISSVAMAVVFKIAAILTAPTVGGGAVLGSLSILCATLAPFLFGISWMANNAMQVAIRLASEGKWYKVARYWGIFGIITGYDAWAV
jgi:hypothetical protein